MHKCLQSKHYHRGADAPITHVSGISKSKVHEVTFFFFFAGGNKSLVGGGLTLSLTFQQAGNRYNDCWHLTMAPQSTNSKSSSDTSVKCQQDVKEVQI